MRAGMKFYQHMISFNTLVHKEFRRFASIWVQTILPPVITTALYFLIFGNVVGNRIGPMQGVSYAEYIAPGLVMMSVIVNAYGNVSTSVYMAKFTRSIEELLVSPIPNFLLLLGFVTGGVLRGVIVGCIVMLTALCFIPLKIHHIFWMITAVICAAGLFSVAGFINALFAKKFDAISIVPTFILTPLTYLGGVFFSINLLPPIWQQIALFNPILYFIELFRYGMLGISDVSIFISVSIFLLFFAVLYWLALFLLSRGVGIRS